MPREKSKKKVALIPILITIIIGCIAIFSDLNTEMNFAFHKDSGETQGGVVLERKASNEIIWDFTSTSTVDLLIIKLSSLEWGKKVFSGYEHYMNEFLESNYVSQGKCEDSGKFIHINPAVYHVEFITSGTLTYHVKWDPFSIDLMWIFFSLLGILTVIGIFSFMFHFNNLIKMKSNIKKYNSLLIPSHHSSNFNNLYKCEKCGINIDLDEIFCHECGFRLRKFK